MSYIKTLFAFMAIWGVSGCMSDYRVLQTAKEKKFTQDITDKSIEYLILEQDRLLITLYKDPAQEDVAPVLGQELQNGGILVNAKGYISLPLVGRLKVAGLTQTQAADVITKKYKKYLNTPSVYVEVANKRLFVLGAVNTPGVIKIDKEKMTLFEALAFAGDFKDNAQRDSIIIVSNSIKKGMQLRTVDLTNFDRMKYASLMLRPNDIVYVQPDAWTEFRLNSNNFTSPLDTITKIASPFVTLKYLTN